MPRQPRHQDMRGIFYHVFNRGHNKQAIFRDDADRHRFLSLLSDARDQTGVSIHNYCLMDNHYHFLLGLAVDPAGSADPDSIGRFLKSATQSYAQYFNRKYDRLGALWGNRFRTRAIESAGSLLATAFYIELNPLKAGLVGHPADNRWSSYAHYARLRRDPLVTDNPMAADAGAGPGANSYESRILEWHAGREEHERNLRELGIVGWKQKAGRPKGALNKKRLKASSGA